LRVRMRADVGIAAAAVPQKAAVVAPPEGNVVSRLLYWSIFPYICYPGPARSPDRQAVAVRVCELQRDVWR
jgi:hypothetical protein